VLSLYSLACSVDLASFGLFGFVERLARSSVLAARRLLHNHVCLTPTIRHWEYDSQYSSRRFDILVEIPISLVISQLSRIGSRRLGAANSASFSEAARHDAS